MTENPFQSTNAAERAKALRESIAMKSSVRPKVDNRGRRIGEPVLWQYDSHGRLIGKVDPTTVADPVQPIAEPEPDGPRMPRPNIAQGSGGSGHTGGVEEAIQAAQQAGNHELAIALRQQDAAHQRQLRNT